MTLGYTPFLDPLDLHDSWQWFLIPLALGISIAYKAVRAPRLDRYWRLVGVMTFQIVLAMVVLWIAAFLLLEVLFPRILPA
jgi:hypothetical protein